MGCFEGPAVQAVIDAEYAAMDMWDFCHVHEIEVTQEQYDCPLCVAAAADADPASEGVG